MTLPDIRIDDRTYDDLLGVLRRQIPPDYTDHNPSDPLITLLELFCWLGEMSLFRMNRISPEHENRYLELLADPPVPATVPVTFTATYGAGGAHDIEIPVGTRVATAFNVTGRRSVFETIAPATIRDIDPGTNAVEVRAREFLEVTEELLGVASGVPLESFDFTPIHAKLGLPADAVAFVLYDEENRSAEYDPNPQIRTFRGLLNGIGGLVSPATGVAEAHFDGPPVEAHFLLTHTPPNVRLTRGDGQFQNVATAVPPIPPGGTETLTFPLFQARIVLDDSFNKATAIALGPITVSVTGGTGAINPATAALQSVTGSIETITSPVLTFSNLTDPTSLTVTLNDGYIGSFDGSTVGAKRVALTDPEGNAVVVVFNVTTAFNGAETAATISLGVLENLIVFGAERWVAQHSVLTEQSQVDPATPGRPRHVMVRPTARTAHFGDGTFGPPAPAASRVVARRYQLILGGPNLIEAGEIVHLLTPIPGLAAGDAVAIANLDDAFGGEHFLGAQDRVSAGLESFRQPFRLVTGDDVERTLLNDFNEYQLLAGRPERVARAAAIMNRRPPDLDFEAPGHVTVMVARELTAADQALWDDLTTPLPAKQALIALPVGDALRRRILRFLDDRRLITTHVDLVAPTVVGVGVTLSIVIDLHRSGPELESQARDAIRNYLSLLNGGTYGTGWPMGRDVYRSEILRLMEELDGVDHVATLSLSPANAVGDVEVGVHELPVLTALSVVALRL